mgnify:CR=1 FL=1
MTVILANRALSVLIIAVTLLVYIFAVQNGVDVKHNARENSNPVLVWWTPFIENTNLIEKKCEEGSCMITDDRQYVDSYGNAVMFYGSNIDVTDFPRSRKSNNFYSLLHEESPKNKPLLCHSAMISLFNFTSTYRQLSNEPITLQYLATLSEVVATQKFVSTKIKTSTLRETMSPVIYIQSDCDTPSNRDEFVKELGKYIQVSFFCLSFWPYSYS